MKIASILYVPPPSAYPSATAILENLKRFPAKHNLIVFSEHDHGWPGQILLGAGPDFIKSASFPNGQPNPWALNNLVFLTALRIAIANEVSHLLYLEADCRVGRKDWDECMFDEYFSLGFPCIAAGSICAYNPCNWSREAAQRWEHLVTTRNRQPDGTVRKNVPVATYGWVPAANKHPTCVFPNGALSVLDVWWMAKLFSLDNTAKTAAEITAWDQALGMEVWRRFEVKSYDVLGFLETIYSGYGEVLTTERERMNWLREGRYVAIHQCKGVEQP